MAYTKIWEINDGGVYGEGKIYDRWGNLTYFVDTSGLTDLTKTGKDVVSTVRAHSRPAFMGAKSKSSVSEHFRYSMQGVRQTKGAIPGYTVTLVGGDEKRQFQVTCTMSSLVKYVKDNAKIEVTIYGPTGTPYDPIPAKSDEVAPEASPEPSPEISIAKALMPA